MLNHSKHITLASKAASETIRELYTSHPAINPEFWTPEVKLDKRVERYSDLPNRFTNLLERTSVSGDHLRAFASYVSHCNLPSQLQNAEKYWNKTELCRQTESSREFAAEFWQVINNLRSTTFTRDTFPRIFRDAEIVADILNGVFVDGSIGTPWWRTVVSSDSIRAEEAHNRLASYRKHQADFGTQVLISEVLSEYGVDISGRLFPT